MKIKIWIKNSTCPVENTDAACKYYAARGLNDPSIIKNNTHLDFNDKNHDIVRFAKINSLSAVWGHLALKFYVYEAIYHSVKESSLLRKDPNEELS